ncbi:MAG TPA: response regulator transcription factor [Chloroflexota bacterium]|nr:response regulator transcription factor [Chloroflexota bacterium]
MSRLRLLIVDDHQLLLEGTKAALQQYPELEVAGLASTGREALDAAAALQPDMVLLDVRLPDMSGVEVARELRARWPAIRIVALSGFDDSMYVKGLRSLGVLACLPKTLNTAELMQAIREAAAGQVPAASRTECASTALLDPLTARELEVLELMGQGSRNGDIATSLGVSIKAVEFHVTHILAKLDARSRSEAIVKAARMLDVPLAAGPRQPT